MELHEARNGWADEIQKGQAELRNAETLYNAALAHRDITIQQRDRLAEALRIVMADYRLDGRVSAEADILACEALTFVKEKQKKESQSCAECDALASHGSNDGPCETHKL
jgi:hypothetical protein